MSSLLIEERDARTSTNKLNLTPPYSRLPDRGRGSQWGRLPARICEGGKDDDRESGEHRVNTYFSRSALGLKQIISHFTH